MSQTTLVGWLLAGGGPEQPFPSSGLCSAGPTQSGLVMYSVAHQLNQLERKLTKQTLVFHLSSLAAHFHEMVKTYYF